MQKLALALPVHAASRRLLIIGAAVVSVAALLSLKAPASAHGATGAVNMLPLPVSAQPAPATMPVAADPALARLIDLHRSATHAAGAAAQRLKAGACCTANAAH